MRRSTSHLRQWRRRMAWYYRVKKEEEQAEEQKEPALSFFNPEAEAIIAKQSENTQYFDADLVQKLSKEAKK